MPCALFLSSQDSVMDAYFAHCKMHSKKATVHRKVHNDMVISTCVLHCMHIAHTT